MQMMLLDRCLSLIQLAYYLIFLLNPFIKHMSLLKTYHYCSTMNTNSIIFDKKKGGIKLFQQIREYSYKLCNWQINEGQNFSGRHKQLNKSNLFYCCRLIQRKIPVFRLIIWPLRALSNEVIYLLKLISLVVSTNLLDF